MGATVANILLKAVPAWELASIGIEISKELYKVVRKQQTPREAVLSFVVAFTVGQVLDKLKVSDFLDNVTVKDTQFNLLTEAGNMGIEALLDATVEKLGLGEDLTDAV